MGQDHATKEIQHRVHQRIIENMANLVHSRHRPTHNFIMNLCSALVTYCFFENKPDILPVAIEDKRQLKLF